MSDHLDKSQASILGKVLQTCSTINDGRELTQVFVHLATEVGELGQEIEIASTPDHYKQSGPDGIIGEAVDVILCALDIIYKADANVQVQHIEECILDKLAKWKRTKKV